MGGGKGGKRLTESRNSIATNASLQQGRGSLQIWNWERDSSCYCNGKNTTKEREMSDVSFKT